MTRPGSRRRFAPARALLRRLWRWTVVLVLGAALAVALLVLVFRWVNPPGTPYMLSQYLQTGNLRAQWVALDSLPPALPLAIMAAEDANFCRHFGLDTEAIRDALAGGAQRGGSTISQQVAKNLFLWQGRSWLRKGLEAGITLMIEATWPKHRILEVYLNIAEFDRGVFGVAAAAQSYYGTPAADLSARQAARLAVVLPNPAGRDPNQLTAFQQRLARQAEEGARTLLADGRADCLLPGSGT